MCSVEAELEAREGGVLVRREARAAEVHGGDGPVSPRLEHQRQTQVRVRCTGETRRHVQSHLQRLCRPAIKNVYLNLPINNMKENKSFIAGVRTIVKTAKAESYQVNW